MNAYLSGTDWRRILVLELRYYKTCYQAYTRPRDIPKVKDLHSEALELIFAHIKERGTDCGEVLLLKDVLKTYDGYS